MRDKYIYYDEEIHNGPYAISKDGIHISPVYKSLLDPTITFSMSTGIIRFRNDVEAIVNCLPDVATYYEDLDKVLRLSKTAKVK